jgi:hypothetical protein
MSAHCDHANWDDYFDRCEDCGVELDDIPLGELTLDQLRAYLESLREDGVTDGRLVDVAVLIRRREKAGAS